MNEVFAIGAVMALVITPLISLVKKESWPTQVKFLIAVALSAISATIQVVVGHNVHTVAQFVELSGTTLAATQAMYHLYFGGSDLDNLLTKIGSATKQVETTAQGATPNVTHVTINTTEAPAEAVEPTNA